MSARRVFAITSATALHAALLLLVRVDVEAKKKPQVAWQLDEKATRIEVKLEKKQPTVDSQQSTVKEQKKKPVSSPSPSSPLPLPLPLPVSSAPPPDTSPADDNPDPPQDLSPKRAPVGQFMNDLIVGLDAKGPRPSNESLSGALDFQPDSEQDKTKGGGALAAARATRRLQRDLAFDEVTVGQGDDWFREVRNSATRAWQVTEKDLDNPKEVAREAIAWNYLTDPSSWDDEAKAALEIYLKQDQLMSKDPIERLPLGNSAATGTYPTSTLRQQMVDDLLRRKEAGLSVRFAFEVDVHHAADGAVTAIDVLRTEFERGLVEKVRQAVEQAIASAPPVPERVADGQPFRSRWLFVATWYIDPPRPRLTSTNSSLTPDGSPTSLTFGSTFDVGPDGVTTQDFDVHLKTMAELLDVTPLKRPPTSGP